MDNLVFVNSLFAIVKFADGSTRGYRLQRQPDGKFEGKWPIFVPDRTSVVSVSIVDERQGSHGQYSLEPCVYPTSNEGYQFDGVYPNWRVWIRITLFKGVGLASDGKKGGITVILTPLHVDGCISNNGEVA